jgi:hypothetical protein
MRDALLNNRRHPSTGETGAHTAWVLDQILGRVEPGRLRVSG